MSNSKFYFNFFYRFLNTIHWVKLKHLIFMYNNNCKNILMIVLKKKFEIFSLTKKKKKSKINQNVLQITLQQT